MKKRDKIDELLDYYVEHMPSTVYLEKNKDRYPIVEKAVREISEMALLYDSSAKIEIRPDELTGTTLCLYITSCLFVIEEIDKFCASLKVANTFEACALTTGDISVSLTFQDAWVPIPPKK